MYEYFIGLITSVTPHYIVLEVNGIGYQLNVANPFSFTVDRDNKQQLYIYQAVRENDVSLFAFKDYQEKQLFLKLISVSGIGPKSALAILANEDHSGLVNAIDSNDESYLTKFPSIGKKTAKQIILDLKDKMTDLSTQTPMIDDQLQLGQKDDPVYLKESLEALLALGYTKAEVKRVGKKLREFDGTSTDQYLRQALKLLMKK
ncbi:Holliday junction branch migration protein RuvA [Ligilactobacillus pobuzihii]|uniref:Holliday junction branch migration complex subunit RuvA n=1 Tax=Ligilactobacillus pobuzihii TaxID=449659 RepID=A0A0R2L8Y0_9LACO|nr:Holliday junction branch migration protein RuvA [Ligilactobacillus pobuzihii]KRK10052.1 Holliday junction DNA helicase RuvA [Ligilactobacillus pobuzihii E100301 = KCTC 13174]KRN96277.1 Holliday junction DNA helicase RuvA [Ligilactobacillus pobuzihii]GEN48473.1 Holliday junction ATP-dependent DNA helicase RuvA [Ligilactobacillus pobuzihii]